MNITDKIPHDKQFYFFGSMFDWRDNGSKMIDCEVGSFPASTYYLLWDNPNSLLEIDSEGFKLQVQLPHPSYDLYRLSDGKRKYKIDAASLLCLLWYYIHEHNTEFMDIKDCAIVLNPGMDFFINIKNNYKFTEEQKYFPIDTKTIFPYIESHLENISGQRIDHDNRYELLKRIEEDNFLPPKTVLPYFPYWKEIESKEYIYSVIKTDIKCECEKFTEVAFSRERNPRLQAMELLGSPETCLKCGDSNWCFISLSSNKKAAKWKCNFCNSNLLLKADSPKDKECSNGSNRQPISKDVQREVWRRDHGRCVECGSQERLEFDHIIPVCKGGADTVRNLQLLCESCNRRKSGKDPGNY